MEKITNYGPILIRKGPYKGRIGYYDDTDMDDKLIVYPNVPTYCSGYYKVSQSAATSVIPTACLAERLLITNCIKTVAWSICRPKKKSCCYTREIFALTC